MKKIKILLGLFILGYPTMAWAVKSDFRIPEDVDGALAQSLSVVGVDVLTVRYTTSTSFLVASTYTQNTSSIAIYGVLLATKVTGSEAAQAFAEIRSTNTENETSELLIPPLEFSSTTRNTLYVFDPPLICPSALAFRITTGAAIASLFYRYTDTSTREGTWIPVDKTGKKSPSADFYGVAVATGLTVGGQTGAGLGADYLDGTSGEILISSAPQLFYGVIAGTGPATDFAVFSDSNSERGSNLLFLPPLFYGVSAQYDTLDRTRTPVWTFPWPLKTVNGLVFTNSTATRQFRVLRRPRRLLR